MKLNPIEQPPISEHIELREVTGCCGAMPRMLKVRIRHYQQTAMGANLRAALNARDLRPCDAAKLVGLDCVTMSGLCSGRYMLSVDQWDWLMGVIGAVPIERE